MVRKETVGSLRPILSPDEAPLWPVAAVALAIIAANAVFIGFRLVLLYPVSPWEAGLVSDGWRMVQGLPVYGSPQEHATTMYGPLMTATLAGVFAMLGPTLEAGRVISTTSGLVLVAMLAFAVARRDWLTLAVSVALLLAINSRTSCYFVETRPDVASAFFAVAGLLVLYRAPASSSVGHQIGLSLAGTALLLTGVMFKQTAIAFAAVPLIAEAIDRAPMRRLAIAATPLLLSFVGVIALFRAPGLWHFMVEVPAQYRISPSRFVDGAGELIGLPLFYVAVLHWLLSDARANWRTALARWLLAALACAIPSSLLAYAKIGSNENTLIPALLAIGVFCAWRASIALDMLRSPRHPLVLRLAAGMLLALALFMHVYPSPQGNLSTAALVGGYGSPERARVVADMRRLGGKVVSFDDPTIALMATGYGGATSVFEADAHGWNARHSGVLKKEIDAADYVVTLKVGTMMGFADWWPKEDELRARGFAKVEFPTASSQLYQLWRRQGR